VSHSTVLIQVQRLAPKTGLAQVPESGRNGWRPGEDPTCMRCGGCGTVKCPNRSCANGTVPGDITRQVIGVNPANGQTFYTEGRGRKTCPVCGGKGRVSCPDCYDGIDKSLRGRSRY